MSNATDSETDRDATETDWLANSIYGYGFGYTKEQALAAMAAHVKATDKETVTVDLVEHVGEARTSMGGWEVEEFVSGQRVEIDGEAFNGLRDSAMAADGDAMYAIENADAEPITLGPPEAEAAEVTPENVLADDED